MVMVIKIIIRIIKLVMAIRAKYSLVSRKKIYIKKLKKWYKNIIYVYTCNFLCK